MRTLLTIFLLYFSYSSLAQLREGFDPDEARDLISLCNSYTFLKLYGSDSLILPDNYKKVFTSDVAGLDNVFQVYEGNNIGVINFRGSTTKASSWVANVYSAMIPSSGVIKIGSENRSYKFAIDTAASVHSGYALAVVILSPIIIEQINELNAKNIYNILITGHSQGGALSHLSRAYLENLPEGTISTKNKFKNYTFANPMCGNKEFADEYNRDYSANNMSYSIINPSDLVPTMPIHYQEEVEPLSFFHITNLIFNNKEKNIQEYLKDYSIKLFEPFLQNYIKSSNNLIERLVNSLYVPIIMPEYVVDINYYQTGSIRRLEPFPIPKIPVNTEGMTKKELSKLGRDENGKYYKKKIPFFQHKPYNYYVAILKEYFSSDYNKLGLHYLPENL